MSSGKGLAEINFSLSLTTEVGLGQGGDLGSAEDNNSDEK